MKVKKNSVLLIVVSVVLVMLLLFGGTLFLLSSMGYVKFKENTTDEVVNEQDENTENETVKIYNFGDEVILTELAKWEFYDTMVDHSKWRVLDESGDYVKLYSVSDNSWGKIGLSEDISNSWKSRIEEKGIDFGVMGNISLLTESDLELFGCDTETLKCSNTPSWLKNGITSVSYIKDGVVNVVVIDNDKDNTNGAELHMIEDGVSLAPVWFTITILKSNLE